MKVVYKINNNANKDINYWISQVIAEFTIDLVKLNEHKISTK